MNAEDFLKDYLGVRKLPKHNLILNPIAMAEIMEQYHEFKAERPSVTDEEIEAKYPTTINGIFEQLKIDPNRVTDGVVQAIRSVQQWNECRQQGVKWLRDKYENK